VRRRLILIGLLVALVSLVAAGCGGDDDEASGTTETPTEPAPAEEEPAEEEPAAPEEEPAEEEPAPAEEETAAPEADLQDSLVILEPDIAPALDPDSSNAAAPELQEMHVNMFEPLIDYPIVDNGEGVLEPQYQVTPDGYEPRLAESWTSTINDDGTVTWTFTLRSGVTSCAGNTLTADDVIYSWQRAKSVSGGSPVTWFLGNVSAILGLEVFEEDEALKELNETEVRKVDDLTVEFTQVNENDLFPRVQAITFQGIFDSTVMLEQATDDDPWAHNYTDTENIPAYGAYCLSNWTKGTEITLTANPNYYRDQPQFQTITIRKVPQSANRVGSILTGDADIVTTLAPQEIADLRTQDSVDVLGFQNNKGLSLGLSFNFEPWNLPGNEKLRQAIAYAMPYQEVIDADFGGDALKWDGNINSVYYGYAETVRYETDVAQAQALVDEFLAENGLDDLSGFSSGFELTYVAERSNVLEPIANRIATALKEIGIEVSLNPISNAEFSDRTLTKFDLPMFIQDIDRPLAPDAGYGFQLFFVSKENGGLNTPTAYNNPAFDELHFAQAATAGEARLPILEEMQQILMTELPQVPIVEPASFIAVKTGVVNCWAGQPYDLLNFWYFRTTDDCQAVADAGNPNG
jgi:peptide/nickel transport system substrate-binding protein